MAKWNYVKIGDVCTVERGGSPRPIDKFITDEPNGINWIKIGDATDSMYITETAQKIIPEGMKKSRYVQPGDFLLSNSMSFGRPYILKIDGCIHDGWLVLRDNGGVFDKRFLYYYLSSPSTYQKFKNMAVGGVVNNLNSDMVRGVTVPIPKMEEQIEIVQTLDNVSNLIFLRKQQLQKMDELVKARFIELFGDQTANPYAWQQTSIGACCTLKSGTSLPADKENEGGAIPYVKVGDMNYPGNEQYITTSSRFVSEQTAGTGVFPVGTVVFPKRGGAIGTNKKRLTRLPICADLNVMGVTAGRRLTPQYLMAYFNTVDLGTLNNGSSVPQINNKDIAPLLICIPPMALQEQFAAFVTQTDKSKVAVQKALDEAQLLFDSLMQKYFE